MAQAARKPAASKETKPEKIVICLNEKKSSGLCFDQLLGYSKEINLKARTIEKDDLGIYQIVGDPTYELQPGDLEVQFAGYPSREKNPIKIAILLGEVFLKEGDLGLTPLIDVSTEYDRHTKHLERLMQRDPEHTELDDVQEITEGFRLEAEKDLTGALRTISRKYNPRVNNVTPRTRPDLLTLLNCMLILEMDGENRTDYTSYLKETIGKLDPKQRFLYEMRA